MFLDVEANEKKQTTDTEWKLDTICTVLCAHLDLGHKGSPSAIVQPKEEEEPLSSVTFSRWNNCGEGKSTREEGEEGG